MKIVFLLKGILNNWSIISVIVIRIRIIDYILKLISNPSRWVGISWQIRASFLLQMTLLCRRDKESRKTIIQIIKIIFLNNDYAYNKWIYFY